MSLCCSCVAGNDLLPGGPPAAGLRCGPRPMPRLHRRGARAPWLLRSAPPMASSRAVHRPVAGRHGLLCRTEGCWVALAPAHCMTQASAASWPHSSRPSCPPSTYATRCAAVHPPRHCSASRCRSCLRAALPAFAPFAIDLVAPHASRALLVSRQRHCVGHSHRGPNKHCLQHPGQRLYHQRVR